jgi:hypothetical protein
MSKFPKLAGKYHEIQSAVAAKNLVFFNEKNYKDIWAEKFVAYIDLIGFGNKSYKSLPSTLNSIVRFHRAINFCKPHFTGKYYHFTDAVYFVAESIEECVNFSIASMNVCTAVNSEILKRKNPLAHMLLLPRITIGNGNVTDSDKLGSNDLFTDIDSRVFLAGDGICDAYYCEKYGFAYSIIISKRALKHLNQFKEIVFDTKRIRNGYVFWKEKLILKEFPGTGQDAEIDEEKDMILPWPFIRSIHTLDNVKYLRLNENSVFEEIHNELLKIQYAIESGYILENDKYEIGKHYAGLRRFVYQLESARSKCRFSKKIHQTMFHTT